MHICIYAYIHIYIYTWGFLKSRGILKPPWLFQYSVMVHGCPPGAGWLLRPGVQFGTDLEGHCFRNMLKTGLGEKINGKTCIVYFGCQLSFCKIMVNSIVLFVTFHHVIQADPG